MFSLKVRHMAVTLIGVQALLLLLGANARADVVFGNGAQVFDQTPNIGDFVLVLNGPQTIAGDYTAPEAGFVRLLHFFNDAPLTVNNGSTLRAGFGLFTTSTPTLDFLSQVIVDGPGSRIEIGSDTFRTGNIRLNGKGDFDIVGGGVVNWIEPNNCDGSFESCDILIGATDASNTGIRVIGNGSLLDASNTGGRLFVGYVPSIATRDPVDPPNGALDSEDFFVVQDGGTVLSNGGSIGKGFEGEGWTAEGVGFVHGTALIDNGAWFVSQGDIENDAALNIAEGDGGSGNLFVVNGGLLDITANPGSEAGFGIGQTGDGDVTEGGSSLVLIDGAGSTVNIDDNANTISGSRVANGFVTVQNQGVLALDSTLLVVSGNSGAPLSQFNTDLALNATGITGVANINLDVLSGGSVAITDADAQGISALIIGQAPGGLPTESASVRVSGVGSNITVSNDPGLAKIPLEATEFGLPIVSNIGTGTMDIEAGGSVNFDNGDFVIAARAGDAATVLVNGGSLDADRVVIGWTDFETGTVGVDASSGTLTLDDGAVTGDVIVDDNGLLNGIGNINGTLFGEGGTISVGLSPGTITVEDLVLGTGTELIMELALNADGSVNTAASDAIIATTGGIDLSDGNVIFELSSADPATSLEDIVGGGTVVSVVDVFESPEEVVIAEFDVTDPTGSIPDEVLEQQIEVVSFERSDCRRGGWRTLTRPDGSGFRTLWGCIRYANSAQQNVDVGFEVRDCRRGGWRHLSRSDGTGFRNVYACIRYVRTGR
ncbi:MAG: hypothetical protein QNJ23_01080 [Woeseiaceae bacterium]|nr:hypothetical protein [Woeseiaceae bacterium]